MSCLGGQRLSPRAYLGCQSLRVRLDSRDIQLTESGGLFAYFVGQTQGPGCMWSDRWNLVKDTVLIILFSMDLFSGFPRQQDCRTFMMKL